MKVIIMVVIGCILLMVSMVSGFKIYRDTFKMWELKAYDISFLNKVKYYIFFFIEKVVFQRDKFYIQAATKHLAGVYDCIAVKDPNIEMANNILKEKTVLEILDYWNAPGGRVFRVRIDRTKNHLEDVLLIHIKKLTKAAYSLNEQEIYHDSKKGTKLRVIK